MCSNTSVEWCVEDVNEVQKTLVEVEIIRFWTDSDTSISASRNARNKTGGLRSEHAEEASMDEAVPASAAGPASTPPGSNNTNRTAFKSMQERTRCAASLALNGVLKMC